MEVPVNYFSICFPADIFFHRFSGRKITLEFQNTLFHGQKVNINLNSKNDEVVESVDNTKIYLYLNYIWSFL